MLEVMYTITRGKSGGLTLNCKDCSHVERVNEFDDRLGSRRTQAAGAMLKHVFIVHAKKPIGRANSQVMERWH
jgi:predicted nucleotide-binding protein